MTEPHHSSCDLVVLVADNNARAAVAGILARPQALGIRSVTYDLFVHPERDPGCFLRSPDFLRPMLRRALHALVIFDRHGCGRDDWDRVDLERDLEQRLRDSGWDNRAAAVCLDPELEAWVWSDSPQVPLALGWAPTQASDLRPWLIEYGLWEPGRPKPSQPKRAVEAVLRHTWKPRSSSIYEHLARTVSLQRCSDPAFARLVQVLRAWFPP